LHSAAEVPYFDPGDHPPGLALAKASPFLFNRLETA
jgi:hypothetical protein